MDTPRTTAALPSAARATAHGRTRSTSTSCRPMDRSTVTARVDPSAGEQQRAEDRAHPSSAIELFRSARLTGEPFGNRAQDLAHCDEDRKDERVVKVPEVLDGLWEKRPADPESGRQPEPPGRLPRQ